MVWKRAILWSTSAVLLFGASCGKNNDPNNVFVPTNNGSNNTTGTNNTASNNTTTTNNDTNNTSNNPTNNTTTGNGTCDPVENVPVGPFAEAIEFRPTEDVELLSCRATVGEIATNGAYILRLQYPEDTQITITVSAIAGPQGIPPRPGLELRKAMCDGGDVVFCDTSASYTEVLEANTPYYLVANGLLDSGGMNISIQPRSLAPCTANETTCDAGVLTVCGPDAMVADTINCPGDCDGTQCAGTMCMAPLNIAPTLNGDAVVVEGNRKTFTAAWDANFGDGCETEAGSGPTDSPGPEMFLLVSGVGAGQTVAIDAEASESSYGFFVVDSCTATSCLDAFAFNDVGQNRGSYTATSAGDVLVAVEAFGDDFDIPFTLNVTLSE